MNSGVRSTVVAVPAVARRRRSFWAGLLAFVGYLVLVAAICFGVLVALRLPWMVAAGIPDRQLGEELDRDFGYAGWPALVERIGWITWISLLLLSTTAVVIARRRHGAGHMIRAVAGMGCMAVSLVCLYGALPPGGFYLSPSFRGQVEAGQIGPVLNESLGAVNIPFVIGTVASFALAITVLAWPVGQPQLDRTSTEYSRTAM